MALVEAVKLDISVVLGSATMPIHQLLRMGRGAVIELDTTEDEDVTILANDMPIAKGAVVVNGNRIGIEVRSFIRQE